MTDSFFIGLFAGATIMIFSLMVLLMPTTKSHKEIISHQCAEYNATTGDFQWLKESK